MCGIFGIINKTELEFDSVLFNTLGIANDSRGGDSCGVFIDGRVEYGVDKDKLYETFMNNSILVNETKTCTIALGHCRKASVGSISAKTAQPVTIRNKDKIEFVLLHNGTITNYKKLAEKYVPDLDIKDMTDSQVMAHIFYYKGYDVLGEYEGSAVFLIVDYRKGYPEVLAFKGSSKYNNYSKTCEDERPFFYVRNGDGFIFSSISEWLSVKNPKEVIYTLPANMLCRMGKVLEALGKYDRSNKIQVNRQVVSPVISYYNYYDEDYYDTYSSYSKSTSESVIYRVKQWYYINQKKATGNFFVNPKGEISNTYWGTSIHSFCFFGGILLKNVECLNFLQRLQKELKCSEDEIISNFKTIMAYVSYHPIIIKGKGFTISNSNPPTLVPFTGQTSYLFYGSATAYYLNGRQKDLNINYKTSAFDNFIKETAAFKFDTELALKCVE